MIHTLLSKSRNNGIPMSFLPKEIMLNKSDLNYYSNRFIGLIYVTVNF